MQVLNAEEIFNNGTIDNTEFEKAKKINLDFSNVNSIDLKAVRALLQLKKVALLNNKSLSISNVKPSVNNMLDVTGLKRTLEGVSTNPITRKRYF